jgi:transcriptional regulator with XRE-family HTH domain
LVLRQVEDATGISGSMLSALERAEVPLRGNRLENLARFYATPPARLVEEMRAWVARARGGAQPRDGTLEPPSSAA